MHFETLEVGGLATNCYVLSDGPPDALVIDPGGDAERIVEHLEANGLVPTLLVNTHGHADHIIANAELKRRYGDMKIAVGRVDAEALTSPVKNMSVFVGVQVRSPPADTLLDEGDVVSIGACEFRVLHTPGHSPGGIALFTGDLDGRPAVFSGDTLFAESVGRVDIAGGCWEDLLASIREKIFTLPDNTVVYPGHGPVTTVAHEKQSNPFVGEA